MTEGNVLSGSMLHMLLACDDLLLALVLDCCALEAPCAAGCDEADLLAGRGVSPDGRRVTNVLVVTTTVRMLHRVHSHATHLWKRGVESARPAIRQSMNYVSDDSESSKRQSSWEVHLWPAVPLDLVFVVCVSSLQQRLLCATPACNLADHCTACAGDDLPSTERVVIMCLGH